jgi:hypothetical protein
VSKKQIYLDFCVALELEHKQRLEALADDTAREAYTSYTVSNTVFRKAMPHYIRYVKRIQCQCATCLSMDLLISAVRNGRRAISAAKCNCSSCKSVDSDGGLDKFSRALDLRALCLCEKEEGYEFRKFRCISGECAECGLQKKIKRCKKYEAEDGALAGADPITVAVDVYESAPVPNSAEGKKAKQFLPRTLTLVELWRVVDENWVAWMKHWDVQAWHAAADKYAYTNTQVHGIYSVEDFAEKCPMHPASEAQSDYFRQQSCTLMPLVLRIHLNSLRTDSGFIGTDEWKQLRQDFFDDKQQNGGGEVNPVLTITFLFLSSDPLQDTFFVAAAGRVVQEWIAKHTWCTPLHATASTCNCRTADGPQCKPKWPEKETEQVVNGPRTWLKGCCCPGDGSCRSARYYISWTDNCAGQYKNRREANRTSKQFSSGGLKKIQLTHGAMHGKF